MKILKFNTNINSKEMVEKVSPYLNHEKAISKWSVDADTKDNILSVSGEELEPHIVTNLVEKAGFKADLARVQGIGGGDI